MSTSLTNASRSCDLWIEQNRFVLRGESVDFSHNSLPQPPVVACHFLESRVALPCDVFGEANEKIVLSLNVSCFWRALDPMMCVRVCFV